MLAVSATAAAAAAGVWVAVGDAAYRSRFAICLLVVAGLLSLTGGTLVSRSATMEMRALTGEGPGMDEPGEGEALTALGVFLFVALPLFAAGAVLHGNG